MKSKCSIDQSQRKSNRKTSNTHKIRDGIEKTLRNLGFSFSVKKYISFHREEGVAFKHTPSFYLKKYDIYIDTSDNVSEETEKIIWSLNVKYIVFRDNSFSNIEKRDFLKRMMFEQKIFNANFQKSKLSIQDKEALTKELTLCIGDESFELLRECNWKTHRKTRLEVNEENIREEIVDIVKFMINIINTWEISPDELMRSFDEKTKKVWKRYFDSY